MATSNSRGSVGHRLQGRVAGLGEEMRQGFATLQTRMTHITTLLEGIAATSQGMFRYTGSLDGVGDNGIGAGDHFPDVYDVGGRLNLRTAGCGGPGQIDVSNLTEVISVS